MLGRVAPGLLLILLLGNVGFAALATLFAAGAGWVCIAAFLALLKRVGLMPFVVYRLLLGLAVPYDGELCCDHLDSLSPGAYRCGQVYGIHIAVAGVSFYHQGSANLIDDAIRHRDVDYFLAGITGRGFTPHYTARILRRRS